MTISLRQTVVIAVVLLAAQYSIAAHALICSPVIPHYRWVGNMATDSKCTDADIQSAIDNMVCPGTIIGVTPEIAYTEQALTITNKSLTILGSNSACDPGGIIIGGATPAPEAAQSAPPAPPVTLNGRSTGGSVITITGASNVTLQGLRITGSSLALGYSGGVAFDGTGSLTVLASTIDHNSGFAGGGIFFWGHGGAATLTLGAGAQIFFNTSASDGGGVYLYGNAHLYALSPYTLIAFNHADQNGGGIAVSGPGPTYADIGTPGYNGGAAIFFNDATNGGGIAVVASADGAPQTPLVARVFTTDPTAPAQISDNSATQFGGGVYVRPAWNAAAQPPGPVGSAFCARDFRIDDNAASDGAAIYADSFYVGATLTGGGSVRLNPETGCYGTQTDAALGALACGPGTICNTINGNANLDVNSQPTGGATLVVAKGGDLDANRFMMRNNQGGRAVDLGGSAYPGLNTCLIADNTVSAELVRILASYAASIDGCTLANNAIGGASVIYSKNPNYPDGRYALQNSIVDQPNLPTHAFGDNSKFINDYLLTNDASLVDGFTVIQGEPTFVDAASGDYRLQVSSTGVDYAPQSPGYIDPPNTARDLAGVPRVIDLTTVPNFQGARDLGAYEVAPACFEADTLFCNGYDPTP